MISTIVLEPRSFPRGEAGRALVVRSLAWLVGAAVAGIVGEVVIAARADLDLADIADAVGSRLAEADGEGGRLAIAATALRSDRVLVMVAGYAPDAAFAQEIARLAAPTARLLAEPATLTQRLFPARAPVVGVLVPAAMLRGAEGFAALARASRGAPTFPARARRLV